MMDGQIRVKTDARYAKIYNDLKGLVVGDFHELFFVCACLGHKYNKSVPLGKTRDDRFWSSTINANEWACYYAMLLSGNNMDFSSIGDDKIVMSAIEEYANGGMSILLDEFLVDYIINNKSEPQLDPGHNKELPKNFLHFIFERADSISVGESRL
jgi:hypothetical protein